MAITTLAAAGRRPCPGRALAAAPRPRLAHRALGPRPLAAAPLHPRASPPAAPAPPRRGLATAPPAALNSGGEGGGGGGGGGPRTLLKGVALGALGAAALFFWAGQGWTPGALAPPPPEPAVAVVSLQAAAADTPARTPTTPFVPATLESMVRGSEGSAAERDLDPAELAAVRLFRGATPSVVNVANLAAVRTGYGPGDVAVTPQGTGSGFIWDKEGHIVTNFHVIRGATAIKVALIDASVWDADLIAGDPAKGEERGEVR